MVHKIAPIWFSLLKKGELLDACVFQLNINASNKVVVEEEEEISGESRRGEIKMPLELGSNDPGFYLGVPLRRVGSGTS